VARWRWWIVALAAVTAAPVSAIAVVVEGEVSIRAVRTVNPGIGVSVDIRGTIASKAAGETVEVMARECGPAHRHYRPVNAYFRAHWRSHVSSRVLVRVPAFIGVDWRPRKRIVDVTVLTWLSGQSLHGRFVELQRKIDATGSWVRGRRARLERGGTGGRVWPGQFTTRFSVRKRGLTLRVVVPDETGAPCFSTGISRTWRS
jgi:hypothetical protein